MLAKRVAADVAAVHRAVLHLHEEKLGKRVAGGAVAAAEGQRGQRQRWWRDEYARPPTTPLRNDGFLIGRSHVAWEFPPDFPAFPAKNVLHARFISGTILTRVNGHG